MTKRIWKSVLVCGWLLAAASLQAHHSLAGVYDMNKEEEKTGTLASIRLANPHGSMHVAVKNTDGTTTEWVMTNRRVRSARSTVPDSITDCKTLQASRADLA